MQEYIYELQCKIIHFKAKRERAFSMGDMDSVITYSLLVDKYTAELTKLLAKVKTA